MNNPFVFGEIVADDLFCDRETEHNDFVRDLRDSQKLFLISPRRYGKTSLLKKVMQTLGKEDIITAYVDLYRASSLQSFIGLYCGAVAEAAGEPSIGIEPAISKKDISHALSEAYEFPAIVAKKKDKKVVVVFDEFQEIANFDGETMEKAMRSHIQTHREVGYVFSGSKKHMLEEMAAKEDRAFYKIGKMIHLQKIPRKYFVPFLREKFEKNGYSIEEGAVERVLDLTEDIPYNAQFLCHELWDRARDIRKISIPDIERTLGTILDEQSPFFVQQWDAIPLNQRAVLKALTGYGNPNVFSQEFLDLSGIGSLPTLQTSLKLLVKKGFVEKQNGGYTVSDVFFREWIRRKI